MKKKNFTLVELLVVIGIITILAGLLLGALIRAPKKAEQAKIMAEVTTLTNAIRQFESTYGVLPFPTGEVTAEDAVGDDGNALTATQYKNMILMLQAPKALINDTNSDWHKSEFSKYKRLNKRAVGFLEVQGKAPGEFVDPNDENYNIVFDTNYDGVITLDYPIPGLKGDDSSGKWKYHVPVIVWSKGADKKCTKGENFLGAKENQDNVYSCPTIWTKGEGKLGGHQIDR
jgi:type II secretory pathway pseudopilin PulG